MKLSFGLALLLSLGWAVGARATIYEAIYVEYGDGDRELLERSERPLPEARLPRALEETRYPRFILEHEEPSDETIVEIRSAERSVVDGVLRGHQVRKAARRVDRGRDEVFTLVQNGPAANRIDLVFMGDGYQESEKAKFLADVKRLVNDIFSGDTFQSYLPLFNVHAVFRASAESGIGKNDKPKNTAYRLYRVGDTLRAIMPGDTSAASSSCSKAPGCDYPIIVANDPYYGGLGGQFAITTSSPTSGSIVLRHELGHNFGRVGEEYDGGEATYFGANFSSSAKVAWSHWLAPGAKPEEAVTHFVDWPWKNLATGAFTAQFESTGKYASRAIRFSASGVETDRDLDVTLNGQALSVPGLGHSDRKFFDLDWSGGFSAGAHELRFAEGVSDGNTYLSSLTIHEYGSGYHHDDDFVGVYPLYTKSGKVAGYRSNHERCLMRNMASRRFCAVCQENNWLKFFSKVEVLDDVETSTQGGVTQVRLLSVPVSPLRVTWYRDGTEVPELEGLLQWQRPEAEVKGRWEVEGRFETPEVRKDPYQALVGRKRFIL